MFTRVFTDTARVKINVHSYVIFHQSLSIDAHIHAHVRQLTFFEKRALRARSRMVIISGFTAARVLIPARDRF